MADLEQMLKKIEGKLRMLQLTRDDTPRIREKNDLKSLERHQNVFGELIDNIHEEKIQIQLARIEKGDEADEVKQWTLAIEEKIADFEKVMEELQIAVKDMRKEAVEAARKEEEQREEDKRKRHYEEEIKLEQAKMQIKEEFEKKLEEARSKSLKENQSSAKLPKLVITKFQGTHLDWQRFWSQFETEIDKAGIGQVAKFSYLKELLVSKVRLSIDGLPFTSEGYERAKNILKSKYGKPSEVAHRKS